MKNQMFITQITMCGILPSFKATTDRVQILQTLLDNSIRPLAFAGTVSGGTGPRVARQNPPMISRNLVQYPPPNLVLLQATSPLAHTFRPHPTPPSPTSVHTAPSLRPTSAARAELCGTRTRSTWAGSDRSMSLPWRRKMGKFSKKTNIQQTSKKTNIQTLFLFVEQMHIQQTCTMFCLS